MCIRDRHQPGTRTLGNSSWIDGSCAPWSARVRQGAASVGCHPLTPLRCRASVLGPGRLRFGGDQG
eukprot:1360018-Alexandrium_andersonii.AAC.1